MIAKEVNPIAIHKGIRIHQYLDDWLVRAISHQGCLQLVLAGTSRDLSEIRLAGEHGEIRAGPQTSLRLRWLPVQPPVWLSPANTGPTAEHSTENISTSIPTALSGPATHVLDRSANNHRKTSSPGPTTYETNTVASQKTTRGYQNH